jgi:hypothetical protein
MDLIAATFEFLAAADSIRLPAPVPLQEIVSKGIESGLRPLNGGIMILAGSFGEARLAVPKVPPNPRRYS